MMMSYIKGLLILVYTLKYHALYLDRFLYFDSAVSSILYLILFGIILIGLWSLSQLGNTIIRYALAAVVFSSALTFDINQEITGDFLNFNSFINLVNSAESADDLLGQYFNVIVISVLWCFLLFLGLILPPGRGVVNSQRLIAGGFILPLAMYTAILFARGGDGGKGLPPALTPLSYSILMFYEFSTDHGDRQPVSLDRLDHVLDHDIVLIIDESISPIYLDINSEQGIKSNLNKQYNHFNIYNYGIAAAITNCSVGSNLTIRYGGTRKDYQKINNTMPSIFEYAKVAGLKTVYIDSQRTGGRYQNLMDEEEVAFIDTFTQFDTVPVMQRDQAVAKELAKFLTNDTAEFILVTKLGAHFPVHDKFPDQFMTYRPVLPRGNFLDVTDTGSRAGFSGSPESWVLYRNSYRNTLLWNIGEFFNKVFSQANMKNVLMIYTSDHGQDLHDRGTPGLNTHCSPQPEVEEGMVPLVVIEGKQAVLPGLAEKHLTNKNRSSHYNIFPTLLSAMKYDAEQISHWYGNPLTSETNDDLTFNTNFWARLGERPKWKSIAKDRLVTRKIN